jgi:hypothetical protein
MPTQCTEIEKDPVWKGGDIDFAEKLIPASVANHYNSQSSYHKF